MKLMDNAPHDFIINHKEKDLREDLNRFVIEHLTLRIFFILFLSSAAL